MISLIPSIPSHSTHQWENTLMCVEMSACFRVDGYGLFLLAFRHEYRIHTVLSILPKCSNNNTVLCLYSYAKFLSITWNRTCNCVRMVSWFFGVFNTFSSTSKCCLPCIVYCCCKWRVLVSICGQYLWTIALGMNTSNKSI